MGFETLRETRRWVLRVSLRWVGVGFQVKDEGKMGSGWVRHAFGLGCVENKGDEGEMGSVWVQDGFRLGFESKTKRWVWVVSSSR